MKIIEILKQRSDNAVDEVKIDLKLYNLADDLEKKSRTHLKRIITILSEFDIHDEKHSEKVISNIELLLGDETLKSLSTYELFLLHLSAFFHDCAMAPSDWEINTMKLSEGSDLYSESEFSIKNDLKTPLKLSSSLELIKTNKENLYRNFEGDVKQWIFSPNCEEELINYLGNLIIDYQNHRNGFANQLKEVKIQETDFELLDYLNNFRRFYPIQHKYNDIKQFVDNYIIILKYNDTEYRTTLTLPKKEFIFDDINSLYTTPKAGSSGINIDGIYIDRDNLMGMNNYYSNQLSQTGIINFTGELRPQLSIDRTSIVDYPVKCEKLAEEMSILLIKEIIGITKSHIEKYNFKSTDKELDLLWEYVFEKIGFADILFINNLSVTEYGNIIWKKLSCVLKEELSIKEFLSSKEITLTNYDSSNLDILSKKLILTKLISAKNIKIDNLNILIEQESLVKTNLIKRRHSISEFDMLLCVDDWNPFEIDFDIISNLYPLIPKRLFDILDRQSIQNFNDKTKILHSYSNGLTSFFSQSPLQINENFGLYIEQKDSFGKKKNSIYNFEQKRAKIALFELNDSHLVVDQKEKNILMVYISPKELNIEETRELEKYATKDPSYVKGVKEGWSLLVTTMDKENIVICAGKSTRDILISKISEEFWEEYKDYTFKFTDGTPLKKNSHPFDNP